MIRRPRRCTRTDTLVPDTRRVRSLGGILLPDSGMGLLDAALACEMAGEAVAPGPLIGQLLAVAAVAHSGKAAEHLGDLASGAKVATRSEEHTSEPQSLPRISYAVFGLKHKPRANTQPDDHTT